MAEQGESCQHGFLLYNNGTENAKIEVMKCVCDFNYCNDAKDIRSGISLWNLFLLIAATPILYNYANIYII
jgi:hypothetical protein